jgi:hypothetical protein
MAHSMAPLVADKQHHTTGTIWRSYSNPLRARGTHDTGVKACLHQSRNKVNIDPLTLLSVASRVVPLLQFLDKPTFADGPP